MPAEMNTTAMTIWTIRTDDNCGDELTLFTSEDAAEAAALEWCKSHWFGDSPCPDNWSEAYETLQNGENFMRFEQHEIDATAAVDAVIASARAQLNDLLKQISQMRGMFSDDDGRIQQAIDDAESWPNVSGSTV